MDALISRLILIRARIRKRLVSIFERLKVYIRRFLFPLYLFPIKLITYSLFYLIKFLLKLIFWPFRSIKNFIKTLWNIAFSLYLVLSLLVISDYLSENYGHYSKFFCGYEVKDKLNSSVVRIVGGYSEGSGFFIKDNQVVTNFHVIADEPSPKIIFSDESFITPEKIVGDRNSDLAILYTKEKYPDKVLSFMDPVALSEQEPLLAAGYALGTDLKGGATIQKGEFAAFRYTSGSSTNYIQADINLVPGMSGGPLTDKCGEVVGVNTIGLSGLSLFVTAYQINFFSPGFTDTDVRKITVDPTTPEGAVTAFYTYLKARRMEDGFNLLSEAYLQKTNFEEWTNRFKDILDVQIYGTRMEDERRNIVFVKFSTKNWVGGGVEDHFYEGTWQTVLEDGVYKMYRSNIKEVFEADWSWFYEI